MVLYIHPKRFYSLDILRGVAALSVVLWHWQHFFLPYNQQGQILHIEKQPLFAVLFVFYKYGYVAVQLFFCLSGFIFFWLYSQRIAERTITLKSFSALRLSRLYPLHFATLLFVTVGQLVHFSRTNTYFVYPFNDVYHFLLNMFFVSSWGFENGYSFNGPIWSVSVEMLLYGIFFVFCRMFCRNIIALFVAVILAHFFVVKVNVVIASGLECFFLGGITQVIYENIVKRGDVRKVLTWLPFLAIFAWMVTIEVVNPEHDFSLGEANWIIQKVVSIWAVFVLFPVTIMSLALLETKRGSLGKRFSFVGDISYSSYLLHFPLQLFTAILITKTSFNQTLFYSPCFMFMFFFTLILVSLASHQFYEVPMQRILRLKTKPAFAKVSI